MKLFSNKLISNSPNEITINININLNIGKLGDVQVNEQSKPISTNISPSNNITDRPNNQSNNDIPLDNIMNGIKINVPEVELGKDVL